MSETLVERMLPARLLVSIGIYLQSAAHLELTIWQIVMLADGVDQSSAEQLTKSLEVKKVTPKLVDQLRRCSSKCPPGIGIRVSALAGKIADGIQNRNLAAHGAFFMENESGAVRVAHYFPSGTKANRKWFEHNQTLSKGDIDSAIEEIDALLREAVSIRSKLEPKDHIN